MDGKKMKRKVKKSSHSDLRVPALFLLNLLLAGCVPARLAVYSRPGGAEVYVNERLVGRTLNEVKPVTIEVKPGEYRVAVKRDGYRDWRRSVKVKSGEEVPVLADLEEIPIQPYRAPTGNLEIRTEPGGVRIVLDGEEIGRTKKRPGAPVEIENLEPGRYELHFEKEGFKPIERVYEVFPNQTTKVHEILEARLPYYAFPTNDDLLRVAVRRALRGVAFMPGIKSSQSIAIVSQEAEVGEGRGLRPLIEDVLVAELAQYGRKVVERDQHLLARIANEAARGDTMLLQILTRHGGPEAPFLYDARLLSANQALEVVGADGTRTRYRIRPNPLVPPAKIPTADQILSYRIVEKTLRVDPSRNPAAAEPMLRREAIVRLFLRLIDAHTGMVIWADRFEASVKDEVPERVYRYLEEPPSRLYGYGSRNSPVAPGPVSKEGGRAETEPAAVTLEVIGGKKPGKEEALFWYYRNLGEAYLRARRYPEAEVHLTEAANLRPGDYDTEMLLAETLLKQNKVEAAAAHYRAAVGSLLR
ncbi:MAG: PEGA domain-containing protein [Candidatus Hydrogenedentota bacterium]|nr:MAG: PEGA domain-containing protein [Candidatus Hydrogenedentota bacterium]